MIVNEPDFNILDVKDDQKNITPVVNVAGDNDYGGVNPSDGNNEIFAFEDLVINYLW